MPSATIRRTQSASPTSQTAVTVCAPNSRHWEATSSSSFALCRVLRMRFAPSRAKVKAISRPMLRLAPVTRAAFPSNRIFHFLDLEYGSKTSRG